MSAAMQQQDRSVSDLAAFSVGRPEQRGAAGANHLAHDARNWLTVLRVYCDLLRTSGAVGRSGRAWLEELSNAVERGHGLVTSLLDSAHASASLSSAPPVEATARPLDFGAAIQRRLPLFQEMAGSKIQVEAKTARHPAITALQEPEFDRILLNLVFNAIDAMPDGGRLKIELVRGRSSTRSPLVLKVSDTGHGIAAEDLSHIFDSGFSTKPTLDSPRWERGLGLAIVRELTLGAGGSVRVRSRIGRGTCFRIELPLLSPSPRAPQLSSSRQGKLALVAEMPQSKMAPRRQAKKIASNRKGTRVPC